MPQISIIIPAFNAGKTISQCLASIKAQTFTDYEVIVVNDGSTDNTANIVQAQNGVRLMSQPNQGAAVARNTGHSVAQGEYDLFCDADIELAPGALQKMVDTLEQHPEASYAYSAFKFGWKQFPMLTFDPHRLKQFPYIHTTALIRRQHFPGFDPALKRFQDWDVWLTMMEQGHIGVGIADVLFSVKPGGTMSRWIPKFILRQGAFAFLPSVAKYRSAENIIRTKHHLNEKT